MGRNNCNWESCVISESPMHICCWFTEDSWHSNNTSPKPVSRGHKYRRDLKEPFACFTIIIQGSSKSATMKLNPRLNDSLKAATPHFSWRSKQSSREEIWNKTNKNFLLRAYLCFQEDWKHLLLETADDDSLENFQNHLLRTYASKRGYQSGSGR